MGIEPCSSGKEGNVRRNRGRKRFMGGGEGKMEKDEFETIRVSVCLECVVERRIPKPAEARSNNSMESLNPLYILDGGRKVLLCRRVEC